MVRDKYNMNHFFPSFRYRNRDSERLVQFHATAGLLTNKEHDLKVLINWSRNRLSPERPSAFMRAQTEWHPHIPTLIGYYPAIYGIDSILGITIVEQH
jgi:hypothetical protein